MINVAAFLWIFLGLIQGAHAFEDIDPATQESLLQRKPLFEAPFELFEPFLAPNDEEMKNPTRDWPLIEASQKNDSGMVRALVEIGGFFDDEAVFWAAFHNDFPLLIFLNDHGMMDPRALFWAANHNNKTMIDFLIQKGVRYQPAQDFAAYSNNDALLEKLKS